MKQQYSPLIFGVVVVVLLGIGFLFGTGILKDGKLGTQIRIPPSAQSFPKVKASDSVVVSPRTNSAPSSESLRLYGPKENLSQKAKELRKNALDQRGTYRGKWGDRTIIEDPKFSISYTPQGDEFTINVYDSQARNNAEASFLSEVLESNNRTAACEFNVTVFDSSDSSSSPLSFCGKKTSSSTSRNADLYLASLFPFISSAEAGMERCLVFQDTTKTYCQPSFLDPYFGTKTTPSGLTLTGEAQRTASSESGCDRSNKHYNAFDGSWDIGLFQLNDNTACQAKYGLSTDKRGACETQRLDAYQNAYSANKIAKTWQQWCIVKSNGTCDLWKAPCANCPAEVCGGRSADLFPNPPSPVTVLSSNSPPSPTPMPAPPPPVPGDIVVSVPSEIANGPHQVKLSGGNFTQSDPHSAKVYSGIAPGVYDIHLRFSSPTPLTSRYYPYYTVCDSSQSGCERITCDPSSPSCDDINAYHSSDNIRRSRRISDYEVAVSVNVPDGGFVDLMFHSCPTCPVISKNDSPLSLQRVHAQERSSMPPPQPADPPVENLVYCSDTAYGGGSFDDAQNVKTKFTVYNATTVEYEAYQDGVRFYNSLQDDGYWQGLSSHTAHELYVNLWGLSPGAMYSWRVRSGNESTWSPWVWGYPWMVSPCPIPNRPPSKATLVSPASGASVTSPLTLIATATDLDGDFLVMKFYRLTVTGWEYLGLGNGSSGSQMKLGVSFPLGSHWWAAESCDGKGACGPWSDSRSVTIIRDTTPPTSSITSPAAGTLFIGPNVFTVGIRYSDTGGSGLRDCYYEYDDTGTVGVDGQNIGIGCTASTIPVTVDPRFGMCKTVGTNKCVITVWAVDGAGNMGSRVSRAFSTAYQNIDSDGDTFSNSIENYIGTNSLDACPNTQTANDEIIDAWPPDFDDSRTVDISDVNLLKPVFNSRLGDSIYKPRYDLNADGIIGIQDIGTLKQFFNMRCVP